MKFMLLWIVVYFMTLGLLNLGNPSWNRAITLCNTDPVQCKLEYEKLNHE